MSGVKTTGGRRFSFLLNLFAWFFTAIPSHAYTLTQTQHGQNIRWHYGQKFFLAGNSSNQSSLLPDSIRSAVVNGLQQWKRATQGMFDFDYWQGTNPNIYIPQQKQDGLNSIFFASQSNKRPDPNVIGYTQVWFNANTGDMIEADIILNDVDYNLTDTPTDTSSHTERGGKRVYLNNVVTHELGHAIGLSHSNSINSSMLYVEFSEQFKLGCDDWAGAKHLYPTNNNGMGALSGVILGPSNEPVAGAVVTAISIARGIPIASVHTDSTGKYLFGALEAGNVSLIVESYQGTPTSVPMRMRIKSDASICENKKFPKNFITEDDQNGLKKFNIKPNALSNAGTYRVSCNEVLELRPEQTRFAPPVLVDRGELGSSKTYTFNANGSFKVTGLGYLLLSPVKVSLSLDQTSGKTLYRSRMSEYKIDDSVITGTAFGPVTIKVEISGNDPKSFPSPAVWPGTSPNYVLVFSDNADTPLSSSMPNNARCDSNEPFSDYQSPPGDPIRNSTSTTTRDGIGFCGNAHASSFHEGSLKTVKNHTPLGSIIGWALPFLVALVCQLFLRKRRAKLNA